MNEAQSKKGKLKKLGFLLKQFFGGKNIAGVSVVKHDIKNYALGERKRPLRTRNNQSSKTIVKKRGECSKRFSPRWTNCFGES